MKPGMSSLMKNRTYLTYIWPLLVLVITWSCAKYQDNTGAEKNKTSLPFRITERFTLPVNLSAYGFLNGTPGLSTKSGNESKPYMPPVDSLIDWSKAKQKSYPDGIVYTQVPFKANETPPMGAIAGTQHELDRHIVPLKCFYIRMEECIRHSGQEYIVTIIPNITQLIHDPDYDFLDKPNFDGIILYAKTDGTYLFTKLYSGGIIQESRMLSEENESTDKTYIGFYNTALLKTKADPDIVDTLQWVYVTESKPSKPVIGPGSDRPETPLPQVSEIERPPLGGGGPPSGSGNPHIEYTLTVTQTGCQQRCATYRCEKDSEIKLQAMSPSPECIFLCWTEGGLPLSNHPVLTVTMTKERSLKVIYVSKDDPECYRLARFATDTTLMKQIQSLRKQTGNTGKEHAASERADGSYYTNKGEEGSIRAIFEEGIKYKNRFHTHPVSNIFTSAKDLLALRRMVKNGKIANIPDFLYGTITDTKILCLRIYDLTKFTGYFDNITTDEEKLKELFKKVYNKLFIEPLKTLNEEDSYYLYTKVLSDMGLAPFIGNSFTEEDGTVIHNWKALNIENNTLKTNKCY